jgi:hypothetical protein
MSIEDYIPRKDSGFREWANTFANKLNASPATYMMTEAQTQAIREAVDDFIEKYEVTLEKDTRTATTIAAKDDARSVAETMCREIATLIKENLGISDEAKIAAGVRPINPNRDPIFCPQTSPILTILGNTPGSQTIIFKDPTQPEKKAKPFGALALQLFVAVTEGDDPAPLAEAKFHGLYMSSNRIAVEFGQNDDGKLATYYARWCGRREEVGPWSLPTALRIAA